MPLARQTILHPQTRQADCYPDRICQSQDSHLHLFSALRNTIEREAQEWRKKHLSFHVYPGGDNPFTTLEDEGDIATAIKLARKTLDKLLEGTLLLQDGVQIWSPALAGYGTAAQAIKTLGREFKVVVKRDKIKRQLHYPRYSKFLGIWGLSLICARVWIYMKSNLGPPKPEQYPKPSENVHLYRFSKRKHRTWGLQRENNPSC